ncbi:MAG: hypothetical protein ACR2GX_02865 [Candidatus Dormibacteria bacterium]
MRRLLGVAALALGITVAVAACGSTSSGSSPGGSPSGSPGAAGTAYLAAVEPYNNAEQEIVRRQAKFCDLTTGSLADCQTAYRDDLSNTQKFLTRLRGLTVPPDAQATLATFITDTTAEVTALQHTSAAPTLVAIAKVAGAELLPAQLSSHHDAIAVRRALNLPAPGAGASPSPRPT